MKVIDARNVNSAYADSMHMMLEYYDSGLLKSASPRGSNVIVYPEPVTTVYRNPVEMILFDEDRDANPFFHLMEAIWVLAGREDVQFLTRFNKRMVEFSDDGQIFHAPYGKRMRPTQRDDQIDKVIRLIKREPDTRRAVLQIWDHTLDLNRTSKDIPCNDIIFLEPGPEVLNMTVCCRSNDMIWGCYGSNVVQFSVLLMYLAARLGLKPGVYRQMSNNFHIYTDNHVWQRMLKKSEEGYVEFKDPYQNGMSHSATMFMQAPDELDDDIKKFMVQTHEFWRGNNYDVNYSNGNLFRGLGAMRDAYDLYRRGYVKAAIEVCAHIPMIDWQVACVQWLRRRIK